MKCLPISRTPFKKQRIPRKLKKKLKLQGFYVFHQRLMRFSNFGRRYAYRVITNFSNDYRHETSTFI